MFQLAVVALILLSLQTAFGIFQIKAYQKAIKEMRGKGLLGIGFRRSVFQPGEIIILSYQRDTKKVLECKKMSGYTVFQRFRSVKEYEGMTLEEIEQEGILQDSRLNKKMRKKSPYDKTKLDKKKGALIQAVEAIERRLEQDAVPKGGQEGALA